MKSFIAFTLLVAAAMAAPLDSDKNAVVLRADNNNIGVDGYAFGYETSNGIAAQEEAQLQNAGTQDEGIEVRGQFQYVGLDGVTYTVTYTAGRDGFKPVGNHIPA